MNRVLRLLQEGENLATAQIAEILNLSIEEVDADLEQLKSAGVLLGWRPILHPHGPEEDSCAPLSKSK